jgi:hypothetical protein
MIKSTAFFETAVEVQKWVERYNELKRILAMTAFFYCPNCGSSNNEHAEACSNPLDISKAQLEANKKTKILQDEFETFYARAIEHFRPLLAGLLASNEAAGDAQFRRHVVLEMIREGADWQDAVDTAFKVEKLIRDRESKLGGS